MIVRTICLDYSRVIGYTIGKGGVRIFTILYEREGKLMAREGIYLASTVYLVEGKRRLDAFEMGRYFRSTYEDLISELVSYEVPWVAAIVIEDLDNEEIGSERLWGNKSFYGRERPTMEPYASLWSYLFEED